MCGPNMCNLKRTILVSFFVLAIGWSNYFKVPLFAFLYSRSSRPSITGRFVQRFRLQLFLHQPRPLSRPRPSSSPGESFLLLCMGPLTDPHHPRTRSGTTSLSPSTNQDWVKTTFQERQYSHCEPGSCLAGTTSIVYMRQFLSPHV